MDLFCVERGRFFDEVQGYKMKMLIIDSGAIEPTERSTPLPKLF